MTGIYKITNIVTGKCYVGSTININKRFIKHKTELKCNKHHSLKLQNSYNKHGVNSFVYETIEECSEDIIIVREQHYIDLYNSYREGYNCAPKAGNRLGLKHSDESKRKMSKSQTGKKLSKETKEKLRNIRLGKKASKETKLKWSKQRTGNSFAKGFKHSDETRKKVSESKMGHKVSIETKKKISESKKGQNSGRNSKNYNSTPILQLDLNNNLIKEWKDLISTKEAGINPEYVGGTCHGNQKTYLGYKWKYKY